MSEEKAERITVSRERLEDWIGSMDCYYCPIGDSCDENPYNNRNCHKNALEYLKGEEVGDGFK